MNSYPTVLTNPNVSGTLTFPPDVNLFREAANVLRTNDSFVIDGSIQHNGAGLGFYGTPNVVKQAVAGSRGGNAALASLLTALAAVGIVIDGSSA